MDPHVTAQRCSHCSHVNPSLHSPRFYKLKLGTVPLSQGQAFKIQHVSDFWRLLQCVLSCVLRADRKTDTASVWLSLLCLYLHFHYALSLSLALALSPSPSLCVMPLFVWRLIKQLPSQPPQPSSSSPRHQLPATVVLEEV